MSVKRKKRQPGWINKRTACQRLEVAATSFDRWGVEPEARVGQQTFYSVRAIVDNRVEHALEKQAAEYEKLLAAYQADDPEALDPIREKALLDRERRIAQELANERTRGEVFPIDAAQYIFARVGAEIAAILEALPGKMKKARPSMTQTQIHVVRKEIAKARNASVKVADRVDEFIDEYLAQEPRTGAEPDSEAS